MRSRKVGLRVRAGGYRSIGQASGVVEKARPIASTRTCAVGHDSDNNRDSGKETGDEDRFTLEEVPISGHEGRTDKTSSLDELLRRNSMSRRRIS